MHPILYEAGKIKIYSYGLMLVVAFFAALVFVYRYAKRARFKKEDAVDMLLFAFISGIIGSRIFYIFLNLKKYMADWKLILEFQKGGLSWHGGMIGGILFIVVFCLIKKYSFGQALDLIYTPAALGLAVGRVGCFLNGCCYGKACSMPWAVTFPYHKHPIPVHPTQLYELVLDVIVFLFLVYWWKKRKFASENFFMMLTTYSVVRFIVEFYRFNTPDQMIHGLSLAQYGSIVVFILGLLIIIIVRSRFSQTLDERLKRKDEEEAAAAAAAAEVEEETSEGEEAPESKEDETVTDTEEVQGDVISVKEGETSGGTESEKEEPQED